MQIGVEPRTPANQNKHRAGAPFAPSSAASAYGKKGKSLASTPAALKAPGSAASTVQVGNLWNSQMRWMLSSGAGKLRKFVLSSFRTRASKVKLPCTSRPVWPLPLPYHKVQTWDSKDERDLQAAINAMVLVLNWLKLGKPAKAPTGYRVQDELSGEQRGIIHRLRRLCGEWVGAPDITAADMGRSAGKFETLEEAVQRLCLAASEVTAKTGSTKLPVSLASGLGKSKEGDKTLLGEVQLAKDVESHRLKFVGKPAFDPSPFLEPLTREIYQTPIDCAIDPCECPHDPPHVQVRGIRAEVLKLLRALDASGRLALFPPEEVRMQHRAGLFSLMKNLTTDQRKFRGRNFRVTDF